MKACWPRTREDWQKAVDAAEGALALDAARKYGLVKGGPEVNVARCERALERGRALGITPRPGAVEAFARSLSYAGVEKTGVREEPGTAEGKRRGSPRVMLV